MYEEWVVGCNAFTALVTCKDGKVLKRGTYSKFHCYYRFPVGLVFRFMAGQLGARESQYLGKISEERYLELNTGKGI